nr:hypothetical protein [Tanacetum cinerariifolium]GEX55351.1 hypothetical protein [Tanacetum cinerariifolium]
MSTQQDIYIAGFENHPPMLNKDNYVPWSFRLLCYTKSKPNGKLIYNSIINGPYVRRMIPKPGDPDCEVPVAETFHEQADDELTEKSYDIKIQDKKAKLFNEWERIVSYKGNDQGLENQSNTSGDESSKSRDECNDKSTSRDDTDIKPSYDTEPMVE